MDKQRSRMSNDVWEALLLGVSLLALLLLLQGV